jgi:uncharacterized protein YeaO (DUF488 family)
MIKIKRTYDTVSPDDGKGILVDRLWPRGMKKDEAKIDEWLKDIAPSDELRKWFSHDFAKWKDFKNRYQKELKSKSDLLEKLRTEAKKGGITLLFSAKDKEHTNKTISKNTYFYTLPSIPSHQGRGNLLPLPWWERARVRGCGFTYELLSNNAVVLKEVIEKKSHSREACPRR